MCCRTSLLPVTGLLAACAAAERPASPQTVAAVPAAAVPAEAAPVAIPWPSGDTCRAILAAATALPPVAQRRLDPAAAPIAVAMIDGGALVPPDQTGLASEVPLAGGDPAAAPCLLLVERTSTTRWKPRKVVAHEIVRSTYRRGSQRVANPEHAALRRKIRELDDDQDDGIIATGDPTIDLIGLVAGGLLNGIGAIWRGRAEGEARAAMAAMPSSFVEPVWEPYTYQLTTVETERAGQLRATLIERAQGLSWPLEQTVHERRRFKVAVGRLPKDRGLLESQGGDIVTTTDVAVWESGGLEPSLAWLATALPTAPVGGLQRDLAMVMAAWAARPPGGPQPRQDVDPAADHPFDDTVTATGSQTGRSSVEQLVTADGVRRYRLVEPAAGDPVTAVQDHP